jgi:penicillin-binding protein 1C
MAFQFTKPFFTKKSLKYLLVVPLLFLVFGILNSVFPLPDLPGYSTSVYYRDSTLAATFLSKDDRWRMEVKSNQLPPRLVNVFLQKEDKYFYYHPGVNPIAIARAFWNNALRRKRTSGASTITMQVARLLQPAERTWWNKAVEAFRALQLEWRYSKTEILDLYLSLTPHGGNIEGIEAASRLYFEKSATQLSPAEEVCLTIIPNRPISLKPGKNNALLLAARNQWLKRFHQMGLYTQEELNDALHEPLLIKRHEAPKSLPHLSRRLRNKSNTPSIYTTIDPFFQHTSENITSVYMKRLKAARIKNAAVMVIRNKDRQVMAYLGSDDFNDARNQGQVDGIAAPRSPGSALKPMVYAAAFEKGILTPASVLLDVPMNFNGYAPKNYDQKCLGQVSAANALSYSLNIPAVALTEQIGVNTIIDKLGRCGFKNIKQNEKNLGLSLILGGCGVSLEELCGLYTALANNGAYSAYQYVLSKETSLTEIAVLSKEAAWMTTSILSEIQRPDLPFNYASSLNLPKVAWKTGTSYGRRDAWSVGYNEHYTIGVWIGNFSGEGVPELNGADVATPLLFRLFNALDYQQNSGEIRAPEGIQKRWVCPESGFLPGPLCTEAIHDYFIPGISSAKACEHKQLVFISPNERFTYCSHCLPDGGYKEKAYVYIPPALLDYYKEQHIPFERIPEHNPVCQRIKISGAPIFVSPTNGKEYIIDRESKDKLMFKCQLADDAKLVYWYLDNTLIFSGTPDERHFVSPTPGLHTLTCADDRGRSTTIEFTVKYF